MFDVNNPVPWLCALLISALSYFLKDAHTNIKTGLSQKATQEALDKATSEWREDIKQDRERHQREMARMEQHYEQKFASAVSDLHKQISELKTDMKDRMDMILKLLETRQS